MSTWTIPARHISEAAFQRRILDMCDWLGLLAFHSGDSRRDNSAGYPDLHIVGPMGQVMAELKKEGGRVSAAQTKWLLALELAGVECHVWRPADWEQIETRLRDLAAKGGGK